MKINGRGDVLGYSWGTGSEIIGVWRGTEFTPVLEPAKLTPNVASWDLLWNRAGLIVITLCSNDHSYLLPRSGVRLDLRDLVDRLPESTRIIDVNERGDLLGGTRSEEDLSLYLLERVEGVDLSSAAPPSAP